MASAPTLRTIRGLLSEIRKASSSPRIKDSLSTRYVLSECRRFQTTDLQLCKQREEMEFLANLYLCYLQSQRKYAEINATYSGRGERTVEDTAKMVGFKLPHDKT